MTRRLHCGHSLDRTRDTKRLCGHRSLGSTTGCVECRCDGVVRQLCRESSPKTIRIQGNAVRRRRRRRRRRGRHRHQPPEL